MGVALQHAGRRLKSSCVDKRPRLPETVLKEPTVVQHEVALAGRQSATTPRGEC